MTDKTLEQEQSDMRKRWAVPAYRLQYGSVSNTITVAEFTLGALDINSEELGKRLEEKHENDRNKQILPETLPGAGS